MHRADGMLRVNYSGTGCGHVRSGMRAAVEASPSAQTVAHLSNCLQDLNAALLLRKREAISFFHGWGWRSTGRPRAACFEQSPCFKMCSGHRIVGNRVKVTAEYKML